MAAQELEIAPEDLEISDGEVRPVGAPSRGIAIADLAAKTYTFGSPHEPIEGYGGVAQVSRAPGAAVHLSHVRVDPETAGPPPSARVDCASRLHICHAACCRLDFALSVDEVEGGRVKWDLGRPYFIRHAADGGCAHLDAGTCGCSTYANRPQVCRSYDCTHDARIWKDFDRMVLNDPWIAEHLGPQPGPRATRVLMHGSGTTNRRLDEAST